MTSRSTRRKVTSPVDMGAGSDPPRSANGGGSDVGQLLADGAHVAIGFGVIGWNKAQVRRRELMKELDSQRHQVETHLDSARVQVATAIRNLDSRWAPVLHDLDSRLDQLSERLPEQVRDIVAAARKAAADTEHQIRQAVGAR